MLVLIYRFRFIFCVCVWFFADFLPVSVYFLFLMSIFRSLLCIWLSVSAKSVACKDSTSTGTLNFTYLLIYSWVSKCLQLKIYHCCIDQLENVAIANALQLEAARRRAVLIRFNFVACAKFEVAQPIRCRLRTLYCVYVTLRCDLDLWPWTCAVDRLRHGWTLYEIWAKSNNPRYCDLNIWPYDLEHVSRAPLCCGIVCTKFKRSQAIRSWNVTIFSC